MGSSLRDEYCPLNASDREDLVTVLEMVKSDDSDISKVAESITSGLEGIKKAAEETLARMKN